MRGSPHARSIAALMIATALTGAAAADRAKARKRGDDKPLVPRCYDVAVKGDLAVLGRTGGIVTLDVGDPARPRERGRMRLKASVLAVALEGDRAWLAAGAYGAVLVDIGDPAHPRPVQRIDVPGKVRDVLPLGQSHVLLAEGRNGFSVHDVSDPERPRRTATVSTRDEIRAMALAEGLLATAEEQAGIRLFDVTRPDNPRELLGIDIRNALDVAFLDDLLMVAARRGGLVLIDVERPRSPRMLGEVPPERSADTVTAFGRLALVGNGTAGVQIVDPFSPDGPRAIKRVRLSSRYPAGRIAVEGHVAFVAADQAGLGVIDLEDVDDPRVLQPRGRRMRVVTGD